MGGLLDFFVPREHKFFNMLEDQGKNALQGIDVFLEFIGKYPQLKKEQKLEYLKKIEELEHRGDRITHFINESLNKVFITPLDKEDINKLSVLLDDVIDLIHSTTKQIVLYDLKKTDKCITELSKIIKEGMKEIIIILIHLKKIDFPKKNGIKIHQLENEADDLFEKAMAELYAKKINAPEMIKLKDVYYNLELVTDKIEDISVIIENIVIKHG